MKQYCIFFLLLITSYHTLLFARGNRELYSIILDSNQYHCNRILEKKIIDQSYANNLEAIINYTTSNNKITDSLSILKKNLNENISITILPLHSQEMLEEINNISINNTTLTHSMINYTLISFDFFSPLIFINALPKTMHSTPLVPWGFVGFDISSLVTTQLEYIREKYSSNKDILILVLSSEKESTLYSIWLEELQNRIIQDKYLRIDIENLESSAIKDNILILEKKYYEIGTKNTAIITLNDEIAIQAGTVFNTKDGTTHTIIGFGGSPEAILAIKNNIISMSIVPNYKEYSDKIIALSKKLLEKKQKLIAKKYTLNKEQNITAKEYISFTIME